MGTQSSVNPRQARRWSRDQMVAAVRPDVQRVAPTKPEDAQLPPDPGYHTRHEPHGEPEEPEEQ